MIKRSYEHEKHIKESIETTVKNIDKGDVVGHTSYSQSVSFEQDKLNLIEDVSYSTMYCRLFHDGKVGNAAVNDPNKMDLLISNATESSLFGEKIDIDLPNNNNYKKIDWLYNEKNLQYSKQELKDIAQELLLEIKKFAPNAKVSTGTQNGCSYNVLYNTSGFRGEYESSSFSLYGGLFEFADNGSFLEIYEGQTFYNDNYNFSKILTALQQKVEKSRQSADLLKIGKMPIIFAPSSMDLILEPIEIAINGKTLYKDLSLFANRMGEKIFDTKFSFTDNPFYYHGSATMPFDDEGTIPKQIDIIKKGVFNNFIYDCTTAKKMNTVTTGHATRGSNSLPTPALSNRIIATGDNSLEDMISSIDYGLMLLSSLGEGQSNTIAGDFSVLAETAYLIENGQVKGRVKDTMISGNVFDLFKNIAMVGNQIYQEGSLFTPYFLIDGVTVSK